MEVTYKQAVGATKALMELTKMDMPIKTSLEVARLSNRIDTEVGVFNRVRQNLMDKYQINPKHGDEEDSLVFELPDKGNTPEETQELKTQVVKSFFEEFDELLGSVIPDFNMIPIKLPESTLLALVKAETEEAKPKLLKPLADFVEIV